MTAIDTNIFIYVLEGNTSFGKRAAELLHSLQGQGTASRLVYAEILSSPAFKLLSARDTACQFLDTQAIRYVEPVKAVLLKAAELRANSDKHLGLGDALHLASALAGGADTFVTNDKDLIKLRIDGLKIVGLSVNYFSPQ